MNAEKKSKIAWRCRRGMLELDLLLGEFLKLYLDKLTEKQLTLFERLLDYPDPVLLAYLMGQASIEDPELKEFLERLQNK